MTSATIGHNGGPDMDGRKHTVRTLWAKALFADETTPAPVMAIAWAIHWYSRADGTGAALSNEQLMLICGISEPTATRGKKWLRDNGYIGLRVGNGDQKTQFWMLIPERRAEATEDARVITETTQPVTTQTVMTPGNHSDDPGVITGLGYIQERDSVPIQYHRDEPPARVQKPANDKPNYWQKAINSHLKSDYVFDGDGRLTLLNGTRTEWLIQFDDDAQRLDLALIEVAGMIQPNSGRPVEAQAKMALARIAGRKRDSSANYNRAVAANKAAKPKPKASRW